MKLRKTIIFLFSILLTACQSPKEHPITSFEECVNAGNPVMESYPEQCRTADGETFVRDIGNELDHRDAIRVQSPRPGRTVGEKLMIRGEARGPWYFEADFPFTIEDESGTVVVESFATAQDEWMTEKFVPFEGEVMIPLKKEQDITLVIRNANASGLPELAKELRIPLHFRARKADGVSFTLFFYSSSDIRTASGEASVPVERSAPDAADLPHFAMQALFFGPTDEEEERYGAVTSTDLARVGSFYNGVRIRDDVATIDFREGALTVLNSAAARQMMVKAAIETTLKSLPTVEHVRYSIDGTVFDSWDA